MSHRYLSTMNTVNISMANILPNTGQIPGVPKNPRLIKDDKFKKLVQSITDDPEMLELRELIVYPFNKKYVIICGNMRYQAMKSLAFKEAPCKVLPENMPVEKIRAILIKDNIPFGEHDWEALANDFNMVELGAWGMDIPQFDPPEDEESIDPSPVPKFEYKLKFNSEDDMIEFNRCVASLQGMDPDKKISYLIIDALQKAAE